MAAALSLNAFYNTVSDVVEVSLYKHDNGIQIPITSGIVHLKQNEQILKSIDIEESVNLVSFFHPRGRSNLSVEVLADGLNKSSSVATTSSKNEAIKSLNGPSETEFLYKQFQSTSVVTTKRSPGSIIFNTDFTDIPNLTYSGGNRVIFNDNKLVQQPLDKLVEGPKYVEVGVENLTPNLLNIFEYSYSNGAVNQYLVDSSFGYEQLAIKVLGASRGDVTSNSQLTIFSKPVVGRSVQLFLALDKISTSTFNFITEISDGGSIVESSTQVLNTEDFLNYNLITQIMNSSGELSFKIELPNLSPFDTFTAYVLLPQVTTLSTITSYTPSIRQPDVYKVENIELDYSGSRIDISLQAGANLSGTLFDLGSVKASYSGTNLNFEVNGTTINYQTSLKDNQDYSFEIDAANDELRILIDNSVVSSGGSGFLFNSNSDLFIGSSNTGTDQINAEIYRFKISNF